MSGIRVDIFSTDEETIADLFANLEFDPSSPIVAIKDNGVIRITIMAWECPVCHVGVRGDVKVCPNCLKHNSVDVTQEPMRVFGSDKPVFVQEEGKVDFSTRLGGVDPLQDNEDESAKRLKEEICKRGIE